jgi:hypothetical protein
MLVYFQQEQGKEKHIYIVAVAWSRGHSRFWFHGEDVSSSQFWFLFRRFRDVLLYEKHPIDKSEIYTALYMLIVMLCDFAFATEQK